MLPPIISLSKSMSYRLQEFQSLLSSEESPCINMKEVWSTIFQDFVEPLEGWEALWLVPEESCATYDLVHPTAVLVTVESCDWNFMTATVKVIGVQDDILLPSLLDVSVIDLHPIKNQNYDDLDLRTIADWLDKFRYFFKYVWYPTDEKKSVPISKWCSSHLENRLQIQCNLQNGLFSNKVAQYYKSLITELKQIDKALNDERTVDFPGNERINIIKNCLRRKVLKKELKLFEEPELRDDLMLLRMGKIENFENHKKEAKFIWGGGLIDVMLAHITALKLQIGDDIPVKVCSTLQEALDTSSAGDVLFLTPGLHVLNHFCCLGSGRVIKGLDESSVTKIVDNASGLRRAVLLNCFGDFELENLIISREKGIAVQVSEKTLKISNCRLYSEKSSSVRGVVVVSGSKLVMENCEIVGFGIGLTLLKGSKAVIRNTRIANCYVGMKVVEETDLSMLDVEISNCSQSAVYLKSKEDGPDLPKSGDIDLLSDLGDNFQFSMESVKLKNNKNNVVVSSDFDCTSSDSDALNETITLSDEETDMKSY